MQLALLCRSDSRGSRVRCVTWPGAGAEVDHRVDVAESLGLERLEQGADLCGGRLGVPSPLISGDPAVGDPIRRAADQGLHRLDVGRDPGTVIARQVAPSAGLGVLHRVEAGVPRKQDDAVSVMRLDEARPGVGSRLRVHGRAEDLDDDMEGRALHLGDPAGSGQARGSAAAGRSSAF